jgi:FKBP-type peptidyl-prolyl cis-trans isomerase
MAGTTRLRDRIFAGFGAFLFLGTASAFTIYILVSANSSSTTNTATTAAANTCVDNQNEVKLAAPDVYKPTGSVTSLQSTDIAAGNGQTTKAGDCLVVKYYGTLASNGTKFDENFTTAVGFAFKIGQSQVIPGWDQGLIGMKIGGTRRLVIPAALGYGSQASGAIPANSDLVFVVKLLRIQ